MNIKDKLDCIQTASVLLPFDPVNIIEVARQASHGGFKICWLLCFWGW